MDADLTKLFVGGITEGMKEEEIRDHFARFGEVKEVAVVKDRETGAVRGFGFVQFADAGSAESALNEKDPHFIGGKAVDVKRALPRAEQRRNYQSPQHRYLYENGGLSKSSTNSYCNNDNPSKSKKIFVGGLPSTVTEDEFKSYFENFGTITDVVIMYDSATQRPRGFGFITFDSEEAVDNVMKKTDHELNKKYIEVKIAVPKEGSNQNSFSNYNSNTNSGRGSSLDNQQGLIYPPYNTRYGYHPGYAQPPVSAFYYGNGGYGGYSYGPYGGIGHGAPYASLRSPWNGQGWMSARRAPAHYGNTGMYPGYFNAGYGSYMGMPGGGYPGPVWSGSAKLNQPGVDVRITENSSRKPDVDSAKLDAQDTS